MQGSFGEAIKSFKGNVRTALEATLFKWSTEDELGREIVRNIHPLERFLPPDNLKQILSAIYFSRATSLSDLKSAYRDECCKHIRQGGTVHCTRPVLLGRAVERETFVGRLYERERSYFRVPANVEDLVNRMIRGEALTRRERTMLMDSFSTWATWNELESAADPFQFRRSRAADEVRASLGLDYQRSYEGKPLLLFVYELKNSTGLCRPTIADAGLHRLFEPPPLGFEEHGWTKTWSAPADRGRAPVRPRPEAVHEPVPLIQLRRVEELR